MPTCQNCKNQWSWAQTIKRMPFLNTAMVCPYCEVKQYPTNPSKIRWGLAGFLTPTVMLVAFLFDLPPLFSLGILVLTFFSLLAIYPVLIDFTSEEEHLW